MSAVERNQHQEHDFSPREQEIPYRERAIHDLDARIFIKHFFQPADPEDSLEYMATELVTPKSDKKLQIQAEIVQELASNSTSRSLAETFVAQSYEVKELLGLRNKILQDNNGSIDKILSHRSELQEYDRACFDALRSFHKLIETTQQFTGDITVLREIKKLSESVRQNELYQATAAMIESMEQFGYGNIGVRYTYFNGPFAYAQIKMGGTDRWLETVKWYAHFADVSFKFLLTAGMAYFFPVLRQDVFTRFLHDAVEKNIPCIQQLLEWRKPLDFFLGGIRFSQVMEEAGLPLTTADRSNDTTIKITGLYNPCLLLQEAVKGKENIVLNDVDIRPPHTMNILTGPNYCGKSVYIKALGLLIGLAGNGFRIPARAGVIGHIDQLFTHFVQPEQIALGESGFTNDLQRIEEILTSATKNSLIIINEPIRTSSLADNNEITTWVIEALLKLQCPTIMVTHAHSVAELVDSWPGVRNLQTAITVSDGKIIPTYRIVPGRAEGSYGVQIAAQHGYTREKWLKIVGNKNINQ